MLVLFGSDGLSATTAMSNPSCLSHISVGTNQFEKAVEFYDAVLATIGCKRIFAHPFAQAYGKMYPEFWVQAPYDEQPATVGNGSHFAFFANSKAEVHSFYDVGLKYGARDDGPPGPRPMYGAPYYGCFLRDLDGNKIEACFWDTSLGGDDSS